MAGPSDVCAVVSEDLFHSLHPKSLLDPGQVTEMCSHVFLFCLVGYNYLA